MKTNKTNLLRSTKRALISTVFALVASFGWSSMDGVAATIVSGNVSGAWTLAGSPYLLADTTTVPSGNALTINPGVQVIVGSNIAFIIEGQITAVGTKALPIAIRGANPSNYWQNIYIHWTSGSSKSRFVNCSISDALYGFYFNIETIAGTQTLETDVFDSSFTNILNSCVFGRSFGDYAWVGGPSGGNSFGFPNLKVQICGCRFSGAPIGCHFVTYGKIYTYPYGSHASRGKVSPIISNCSFLGMRATAIKFDQTLYSDSSYVSIHNNIVVGSTNGIQLLRWDNGVYGVVFDIFNNVFVGNENALFLSDFSDSVVQNNIFSRNKRAVIRDGSLGSKVEYNCLSSNLLNFVGYPASYGQPVFVNQNGTPADILMNILQDPAFEDTNTYRLLPSSPCIDAGSPLNRFKDGCFPPSKGTEANDQGAYGGLEACNWLDPIPKVPARLEIVLSSKTNINLSWNAIPRSEYQLECKTNAAATNWFSLSNGWSRAERVTNTLTFAKFPAKTNLFYRIRSLGRTPGN